MAFGKVPEARIPQALALITRDSAYERDQFALDVEEIKSVWSQAVEGFQLAIDFVRGNLGVARSDFLPYDAFLPVLLSKTNWLLFQNVFDSKGVCNRMFGDLREYRNALKRNRDISEIVALQGQAAIVWLSQALELDLSEFGLTSPE